MEFMKTVCTRKSVRSYRSEQISEEQLNTILKAAYSAPVGRAQYDILHISVVQDSRVNDIIDSKVQQATGNLNAKPTYGAPTLFVISTKTDEDGKFNNSKIGNVACILENIQLAATDIGLGSVYLCGCFEMTRNEESIKKALKVPEGFGIVAGAAVGYPIEPLSEREIPMDRIATTYIR